MANEAMQRNIEFLEQVLANQRTTLRLQIALSVGGLVLGLGVMVFGHFQVSPTSPGQFNWIPLVAGLFPPAVTTFPLKDLGVRRDKMTALTLLIGEFKAARDATDVASAERLGTLQQRFDQLVDRVLGG